MTSYRDFSGQLRDRLSSSGDKPLLRILTNRNLDQPIEFTGPQLVAESERLASQFVSRDDRSVVLLLLPHSPELFLLHLGLVLRGHVPAILAWPTTRIDPEKYQRNLVHQLSNLPADRLITLPRLADNLGGSLPYPASGVAIDNQAAYEKVFPAGAVSTRVQEKSPSESTAEFKSRPSDQALFLQFSGGTTGAQKAIVVTASMLTQQLELLQDALDFTAKDEVVSWLPMYHDMGLIACLWMPLWHGAASTQIGANDWVLNPELLFRYVSRYRSTFCWLPNFSFSYLGQRRPQMKQQYDLGTVRGWINCSEPVRLKSMTEFAEAFADWGVRKEALQASYAMAETTFAITQSKLGRQPLTIPRLQVNRNTNASSDLSFNLVDEVYESSGPPIRDTELKIVSAEGKICDDTIPGEIFVRTPCLFSGYWGSQGFQTHSLHDGWHATGDFGFMYRGELFVIGRLKDIAIVGGQNIFPEDVETVVNTIEGVYPGRVVAFGLEDPSLGTQSLAVVAEARNVLDEDASFELETVIRNMVLATVGIAPRYVAVVPQRWIVKSTAGKISRRETRERFIQERFSKAQAEVV